MIDLDALDALHAAATPGEWQAVMNHCYCEIRVEDGQIGDMCASTCWSENNDNLELSEANAKVAAALHNAYPAISKELRELRTERDWLKHEQSLLLEAYVKLGNQLQAAGSQHGETGVEARRCYMSPSEWTRDHDRLIAERIEGLRFIERGMAGGPELPEPPHYPTDLLACYRAAETWRKGGDGRMYILGSAVEMAEYTPSLPEVTMGDWCKGRWTTHAATITEAFASALYEMAERTEP